MSIFQPTHNLNLLIRQYGIVTLNDTTPVAPNGRVNIMWETDTDGNLAASVPDTSAPLNPRGVWSSGTTYAVNDLIVFSGSSYLSTINGNIGHQPDTNPSDWQLIAQGGGGSNPGTATEMAFYQTTGSTVSPTSITSNGSTLNVPGMLSAGQAFISSSLLGRSNPLLGQPAIVGSELDGNIYGPGWSLGNGAGWSVAINEGAQYLVAQRGIAQNRSGVFKKHAVGDTAGIYSYVFADGGLSAASDEGVTGATFQANENPNYFFGTVASSSQIGGTPTLAFTTGNNWTTDGAFLLNITKGTISGNMNGNSVQLSLDIGSGSAGTFLNYLPVTTVLPGGALPLSTAIGIATAPIPVQNVNATNPQSVTMTVNLALIGGIFKPFTLGSVVTVAGINYPEQSVLTAVTSPVTVGPNKQQTLTMLLRNPNSQAIIFQGGLQGQYISFDANISLSGIRSSYFAFGSLNGSDLIYGLQFLGTILNHLLPQIGAEAAQPTGSRSGFHLYPGAEIVANNDLGFACTLEQNGVHWGNADAVENPHYPVYGGNALFVVGSQFTSSSPSAGAALISGLMDGPGFGRGTAAFRLVNNYASVSNGRLPNYAGSGGPLTAPACFDIQGQYNNLLSFDSAPNTGSVLRITSNPTGNDLLHLFDINYAAGGNMFFHASTGMWAIDGKFDAQNGFLSNHVPGSTGSFTSQDGKTVTVSGGIIIGIV